MSLVQQVPGPQSTLRATRILEIERAEIIAGALFESPQPVAAARLLADALTGIEVPLKRLEGQRLHPRLIEAARRLLGSAAPDEIRCACEAGAAWVLGARSVTKTAMTWQTVISYPANKELPQGTDRTTGETVAALINGALETLRIAAAYFDAEGVKYIAPPLIAAARRGVAIQIAASRAGTTVSALGELVSILRSIREPDLLTVRFPVAGATWPHLKVVVTDRTLAYVGSANMTGAALAGRNLELGVLLRGPEVMIIYDLLGALFGAEEDVHSARVPGAGIDGAR